MKMAICQMNIKWEDKQKNYEKFKQYVEKAKKSFADVVFFPEMSFTGFSMNVEKTSENNFETLQFLQENAANFQIYLGAGWVKKNKQKAENHYSVIGPNKEIILDYIKIHSFSYGGEDKFFIQGDSLCYGEINRTKFSVFICYDLRFPELFQAVTGDCSLIIVPANWPQVRARQWITLLQARAMENHLFLAGVNCVGEMGGQYYSGDSCIVSPDGELLQVIRNEEGMLVFDIPNITGGFNVF
jgi:predicted amidohydrolase